MLLQRKIRMRPQVHQKGAYTYFCQGFHCTTGRSRCLSGAAPATQSAATVAKEKFDPASTVRRAEQRCYPNITLDHRRAWCLKQYEVGVGHVVCTRARVSRLQADTDQPVNKQPFHVFCATMMALNHAAKLSFSNPS